MVSGSRKHTSKVLDFFELNDVMEKGTKIKKAMCKLMCKLCDGVSSAYSGGTSNLHNHLKAKHPSQIKEKPDDDIHKLLPLLVCLIDPAKSLHSSLNS